MKGIKIILIFIPLWVVPLNNHGQHSYASAASANQHYIWFDHLELNELVSAQYFLKDLEQFIVQLDEKRHRYKDPTGFLKHVYYKVHQKYLRHYQMPSTLIDLLHDKKYYCLTGTALYSIILKD